MTLSKDELENIAHRRAGDDPQPFDLYRHYKGDLCVIVARSIDEGNFVPLVTYRSLSRGTTWTRPLRAFSETVPYSAENPAGPCPRFERVDR